MKKLFTLIVMAIVLVPGFVEASEADFRYTVKDYQSDCADDVCTNSLKIYFYSDGDPIEITDEVPGSVTAGRLVRSIKITDVGDEYGLDFSGDVESNVLTLEVQPLAEPIEEEVYVATIEWTFDDEPDRTEEDCSLSLDIGFGAEDVEVVPQITPETGVSLPVIVLGIAAIAGLGVYMVTRKNTKLFKI